MATRPSLFALATKTGGAAGTTTVGAVWPAGIIAGHLLVAILAGAVNTDAAGPTGWTALPKAAGAGNSSQILYKIADGTESGTTTTFTSGVASKRALVAAVIQDADPISPFDIDPVTGVYGAASTSKVVAAAATTQPDVLRLAVVSNVTGSGATQETAFTFPTGLTRRAQDFTTATAGAAAVAFADSDTAAITDGQTLGPDTVTHVQSAIGTTQDLFIAPVTPTVYVNPVADSAVGTWAAVGAANIFSALADASDASTAISTGNPVSQILREKIDVTDDPSSPNKFGAVVRARAISATHSTLIVRIYQGGGNVAGAGTLIMTRTLTDTLTGAFVTYQFPGTRTEAGTITNWDDLYLETVVTAS